MNVLHSSIPMTPMNTSSCRMYSKMPLSLNRTEISNGSIGGLTVTTYV